MILKLLIAAVATLSAAICQPAKTASLAQAVVAESPAPAPAAAALHKQVYVLRHLEKGEGEDPSLSAAGAAQAQQLAEMLAGSGITAIFATPTRRAQETAAPLAGRLGIPVQPYDPRNPDALRQAAASASGNVLVVGHSNTVPDLVRHFGGTPPPPLSEEDYGTVWFISPGGEETSTLLLPSGAE